MDTTESTQDDAVEVKDETPEPKAEVTPDEKKTTPKKDQKTFTEDDLRERGRDDASLAQKRQDLQAREAKILEAEEKIKWSPVISKYGQERADKIKTMGIFPESLDEITELLGSKVSPTVQKADSGKTSGGSGSTFTVDQLNDREFWTANKEEILKAQKEGRIK